MVTDALAGGGARAESFAQGMVNGVHYLQLFEPIKQPSTASSGSETKRSPS